MGFELEKLRPLGGGDRLELERRRRADRWRRDKKGAWFVL